MWYGKIAIILYIFSFGSLFFTYYINQIFPLDAVTNHSSVCIWSSTVNATGSCSSYNALKVLAGSYSINNQINTSLIFGDFIAGVTVLFGILTGQTIANALTMLPFFDASMQLLVQLVFSGSSVLLWIYIVANRSL